jgi:hypothetical protein
MSSSASTRCCCATRRRQHAGRLRHLASLPRRGELPVGLMLWHAALHDDAVLALAQQVERAL